MALYNPNRIKRGIEITIETKDTMYISLEGADQTSNRKPNATHVAKKHEHESSVKTIARLIILGCEIR